MVEKTAADYANIFRKMQPEREIDPICANIEDMLARLDEFETLLSNIKVETDGILDNCIGTLNDFSEEFQVIRERIDNLESFINIINANVEKMTRTVDIAEEELNVTNYSLKGLILKPLLNNIAGTKSDAGEQNVQKSNLKDGIYQPIPIFKTNQYFGTQREEAATDNQSTTEFDGVQS